MNQESDHHVTKVRSAEVRGVVWHLMLSFDLDEWVVKAETDEGEAPEPFRTTDQQEAQEMFDNFEQLLAKHYQDLPEPPPAPEQAAPPRRRSTQRLDEFETLVATAIIGIDTLWGGDVNNPSGLGRFIADCYCSGKDLPPAYHDELAAELRASGGVGAEKTLPETVRAYIARFGLEQRIAELQQLGDSLPDLQGAYLASVARSLEVMFDLVQEGLGDGPEVSYERAVMASTGEKPALADTTEDCRQVEALVEALGFPLSEHQGRLGTAVDAWRSTHAISREDIRRVSSEMIPKLDRLTHENLMPHLPVEVQGVPRANIQFLPIENAWFSGSMNYLGRARKPDGSPEYEATYEINASLEISRPEFEHLVSHEVVPGHVMTFAFLQHFYHVGLAGFEATIQTMNTRASTLSEGIANNALLFAMGIDSPDQIEDDALRLGVLLSLMQDKAKNNASYLLYAEGLPTDEVAERIREQCLISQERAGKLAGAWGSHPVLGRMYLPCYHIGTRIVGDLLRAHGPEVVLPAIYGCHGVVDIVTAQEVLS